jgi:hypothetical protein
VISLLGIATLAGCDADSTGPTAARHPVTVTYDRNAYVAPLETQINTPARAASAARSGITTLGSPNVIVNGSFEAGGGSLTGWTVFNQDFGSGSWYVQSGTISPVSGFDVPPPTDGTHAAMTDQFGPGTHVLYQDVTVPAGAALEFDVSVGNRAGVFWMPATLNFNNFPNQHARADIMTTTSAVTAVGTGVIANLFRTAVGDPPISPYRTITTSLASLAGRTVRIRFSEVDNQSYFNLGIDNVSLRTTYDDLCASAQILVSQPGIQNALCSKLSGAAAAEARGDTNAQNGLLRAFRQQVEAQTGKAITETDAALLIAASESLIGD